MNKKASKGIIGIATCACLLLGYGMWIPTKAYLAQYLLHRAWEKSLTGEQTVKPWPWADTWPVARLQAPGHGVDAIVLAGTSGEALAFGPGHLSRSGTPGLIGNCVLAGHRDTSFTFLEMVKEGEILILQDTNGINHLYQITATSIMEAGAIQLEQTEKSWLTLITCYPFEAVIPGGPLRFIVFAKKV